MAWKTKFDAEMNELKSRRVKETPEPKGLSGRVICTTSIVSSNPIHGEVYLIQHYVMRFVSDLRQVSGFLRVLRFPPPIKLTTTEIFLKVALNTINLKNLYNIQVVVNPTTMRSRPQWPLIYYIYRSLQVHQRSYSQVGHRVSSDLKRMSLLKLSFRTVYHSFTSALLRYACFFMHKFIG
jgi:hypothetical protein